MDSKKYIEFINEFVKDWHITASSQLEQFNQWVYFFNKYPFSFLDILPYRFFPEPYIGDPLSNNLRAVFINLNPGTGGMMQDVYSQSSPNINQLFEQKGLNYYDTIQEFIRTNDSYFSNTKWNLKNPLLNQIKHYKLKLNENIDLPVLHNTYAWWHDNRLRWFEIVFNYRPKLNEIFGIELTPWHSTNFASMGETAKKNIIWHHIISPAINISKKISNPYLNNGETSVVLIKGAVIRQLLDENEIIYLKNKNLIHPDSDNLFEEIGFGRLKGWYKWLYVNPINQNDRSVLLCYSQGGDMKFPFNPSLVEGFKNIIDKT